MAHRRARLLLGALGLTMAMGVGLVGPASAASITPIKPLNPTKSTAPIKAPASAPSGPRIPFKGWSPTKIKNTAVRNASRATSVHVKGSTVGQDEKITWDALLTRSTGKMHQTSTVRGSFSLIRIGTRIFLAGDKKFWMVSGSKAEEAALLQNQWVELLGNNADVQTLRKDMTIGTWVNAVATFKVTKRVVGKKVTGKSTVGLYEPGTAGGVLYVAAAGKPYPMGAVSNDRTTSITYSDWNRKYHITAPAVLTRVTI